LQLAVLPAESKECYDEAYLISQLAGGPGGKLSHSLFYEPRVSGNIVRYALAQQLHRSLLAIWDRINGTKEPEHFKVADYNDHNYGEGVLKNQQEAGIEVDMPGILPEDILCRRRMLDMLFPSIYLEPTNADNLMRGIKEAYQEAGLVNVRVEVVAVEDAHHEGAAMAVVVAEKPRDQR